MIAADRTGLVRARGGRDAGGRRLVPAMDHGPAEICSRPAHGRGGTTSTASFGSLATSSAPVEAHRASSVASSAAWQKGTGVFG